MKSLIPQRFGIIVEAFFPTPIPYSETVVQRIATKAVEKFRPAGLIPSAIISSPGDRTFGHSLSFSALSGKCSYRISSEKLEIRCIDPVIPQEATAFYQFVIDSSEISEIGPEVPSSFQIYGHVIFESISERQEFLGSLLNMPDGVLFGGFIVYASLPSWKNEIRLQLDRSNAVKDGLFVLSGTWLEGLIDREKLTMIYCSFDELGLKMGFKIDAARK